MLRSGLCVLRPDSTGRTPLVLSRGGGATKEQKAAQKIAELPTVTETGASLRVAHPSGVSAFT